MFFLPEAYISGYISEAQNDWPDEKKNRFISLASQTVPGPITKQLGELACEQGLYICCGLVERDGEQRYITSVMVSPTDGLMVRY